MAMTPETEAAREHIATALELLDGEAWFGVDAQSMERASNVCATLVDLERLNGQFPSPWFEGMHSLISKIRNEMLAAREQLERLTHD